MPDDATRTYETAVELNPADQAALERAAECFGTPMRVLLKFCLRHGIDWAKDFGDMERLKAVVPSEMRRPYPVTVYLNAQEEAELAAQGELTGMSNADVLREAAQDGLELMRVIREGDLADDAARQGRKGSVELDDDLPF